MGSFTSKSLSESQVFLSAAQAWPLTHRLVYSLRTQHLHLDSPHAELQASYTYTSRSLRCISKQQLHPLTCSGLKSSVTPLFHTPSNPSASSHHVVSESHQAHCYRIVSLAWIEAKPPNWSPASTPAPSLPDLAARASLSPPSLIRARHACGSEPPGGASALAE